MIPSHLLPNEVAVVRPAASTADPYGTTWDYGSSASRSTIAGWLQQDQRVEVYLDGRDILRERWLLVTNYVDIDANDRIEWDDHPSGPVVFSVDGPPAPVSTPRGADHLEATLRLVEG